VGLKRILRPKRKEVTGKCKGYLRRAFLPVYLTNDYSDDQIKNNVLG
jgi:hypothetical protein